MGIKPSLEPRDLPDNVLEQLRSMDFYDPDADHDSLPDMPSSEGMVRIQETSGDEYVTHAGLVEMAHQDGLALTHTEPVQVPPPQRRHEAAEPVIFRAVVATRRGVFTAYGDAHENDTMVDAVIRMAETRALNRALRTAVNVGGATAEEMPDEETDWE